MYCTGCMEYFEASVVLVVRWKYPSLPNLTDWYLGYSTLIAIIQ